MMDPVKLKRAVEAALGEAQQNMGDFGAVNWASLYVADIECRRSLIYEDDDRIHVIVEEAGCPKLRRFLQGKLQETSDFPGVIVEVEW